MADLVDNPPTQESKKSRRRLPPLAADSGQAEDIDEDVKTRKRNKRAGERTNDETDTAKDPPSVHKKKRRPKSAPNDGTDAAGKSVEEESPRRRRPKKKLPELQSGQEDVIPTDTAVDPAESLVKKPRRKKKKKPIEEGDQKSRGHSNVGLAADLYDMEDDVVDAGRHEDAREQGEDNGHINLNDVAVVKAFQSQPADKLYIEQKSRFRSEDKVKLAKRLADEELHRREAMAGSLAVPNQNTLQFALVTHRVLRKFALMCHGLLAGYAVCHVVLCYLMTRVQPYAIFIETYHTAALPAHEIHYFLFIICTVSALDRFDPAGMTRHYLIKSLTLQNGAVSAIVYLAATGVSLGMIGHDDNMMVYGQNATLWLASEPAAVSELRDWTILNAIRAAGATLGWLIIALQPSTDRLGTNLLAGDENAMGIDGAELSRVSMPKRRGDVMPV